MEAKELRLGNWVYGVRNMNAEVLIPDCVGRVDAIGLFGDITLSRHPQLPDWTIPVKHLSPIPLTPEVLKKCGFVSEDMADLGVYIGYEISVDLRLNFNAATIWIGEYDTGIMHLHQLQNLTNALTSTELKY